MAGLLLTSIVFIAPLSHVAAIQFSHNSVQKIHGAMIDGSIANFQENNWPKKEKKSCKPAGKLYFAHVMKDGGESVNDYFQCLCEKHECSIVHSEGPVHYKAGVESCEPSICTSHGMVDERAENCGSSFKKAPVFTVMRSPVSRIVSLYHFHRDLGHDFCVKNTLWQVLQIVEAKVNGNTTEGLDHEWSEAMVDWYFANGETISLVYGDESQLAKLPAAMKGTMQSATGRDLIRAKEIVKGFTAIFLTDKLEEFPKLFGKSSLFFSWMEQGTCELGHVGAASNYPDPSKKEVELIEKLNWADIELYKYAKTLHNLIK